MRQRRLALGLVGCGRLAEAGYVPALAAGASFDLVAVADPDRSRAARLAAAAPAGGHRRVSAFQSAAEMLAAARPDAVVLATPAATHVADATVVTAAGVPLLVEKPPAPDAPGAAALAALVPPPLVGFNRRFDDGARAVRDTVPPSGRVDLRLRISYRRTSWGAHTVHDDALLDLGPHLVDWARWLSSSEVVEVTGADLGPDRAGLQLQLANGRATLSAATDRVHSEIIEARDADGVLLGRHRLGGAVAAVRGRVGHRRPVPLVATLVRQLDAFAGTVRGDASPGVASATDGYAAMLVIDAARASAARGEPVPVVAPTKSAPDRKT